ncbi:MAG: dihydroorotate dehydrogenase-like protein [Deltaproteobacteria bacterium]|nr:dihydroorotate dehydrogenase-like protein [Deltaproteobacteria bacterium]
MSVDLKTKYLGLNLKNPLVASSSPLTGRLDFLRQLEDNGIGAVVLPSIFEEQIEHEQNQVLQLHQEGAETFPEALGGYFPAMEDYNTGPDTYLEQIRAAKEALSIPVLASLNGVSASGWVDYAKQIQDAGADGLELNVYFIAADTEESSFQVEWRYLNLVAAVREAITIPLAVKVHPFFSAPAHMSKRLVEAGANGLVLFNRFYQPDIDLEALKVRANVQLSTSSELRLPLRWIAILRGRVAASLAATSGTHTAADVLKLLFAGADVAMMASALLRNGPTHVRTLLSAISTWLDEHEYVSVEQMRGSMSQQNCEDPAAFERANYMAGLTSYTSNFEWA